MKRRSIFKLFACATAYAAMEVCGLQPFVKDEVVWINQYAYVDYKGYYKALMQAYSYKDAPS